MPDLYESVETVRHDLDDHTLERVLRFQGKAPLAMFSGHDVAREAMCWEEHSSYRRGDHAATWSVHIADQYAKYFESSGDYRLEALGGGRTARIVEGHLNVNVKLIRFVAERVAIKEVRKTYEAEAASLRVLIEELSATDESSRGRVAVA